MPCCRLTHTLIYLEINDSFVSEMFGSGSDLGSGLANGGGGGENKTCIHKATALQEMMYSRKRDGYYIVSIPTPKATAFILKWHVTVWWNYSHINTHTHRVKCHYEKACNLALVFIALGYIRYSLISIYLSVF